MIEHYAMYDTKYLSDRFGLTDGVPKGVKPRFNVSPNQAAPVIVKADDKMQLRMMKWGIVPGGAKDVNSIFRYKTFNTKSEQVFSKPVWENAIRQQRCIIAANGFYMIRSGGFSDAYYFSSTSQPLLGLAGMYTLWTDPSGNDHQMFTLLTIESNNTMPLPFKRMPVIIHSQDEAKWLDQSVHDFSSLVTMMRPFEGNPLEYRKASSSVMSTKNDSENLINLNL